MNSNIEKITITAKQAAKLVGVSYWCLLEFCKRGEIPHISIGNRKLFRREVIERWLAEREARSVIKRPDIVIN